MQIALETLAVANNQTLADPATIAIDYSVPLPASEPHATDWTPLLDRMQVGQSAKLPRLAWRAVASAIADRHEATHERFVIRRLVANQIRVWRTA